MSRIVKYGLIGIIALVCGLCGLCLLMSLVSSPTSSPMGTTAASPATLEPTVTVWIAPELITPTITLTTEPTATPTEVPTAISVPVATLEIAPLPAIWACPNSLDGAAYVGSVDSDKYHKPGCRHVDTILLENRICFANLEATRGRVSCGTCKPPVIE